MPINRLPIENEFTPEQRHVIELAFADTLRKLNLVDRSDPICELVAHEIIEISKCGATDASAICGIACRRLSPQDKRGRGWLGFNRGNRKRELRLKLPSGGEAVGL